MRPRFPSCSPVALVSAVSVIMAGCEQRPPEPPVATPPAPASDAPPAAAALSRADLLGALQAAAAAYAAGRAGPQERLAGRRFAVRQAFGCRGPAADGPAGLARWTWSKDHAAIEIALTPADWSRHPAFAGAQPAWEAIEGFWLTRPWLPDEGCPVRPVATESPTSGAPAAEASGSSTASTPTGTQSTSAPSAMPSPETAGIAAVFAHGGSRVGRRQGKPFAFTLRDDSAPHAPPANGYRLVLEGRLTAFADGRAIRCHAPSPDVRPVCIAVAEIDRVAFEDPDGKLLREWRLG